MTTIIIVFLLMVILITGMVAFMVIIDDLNEITQQNDEILRRLKSERFNRVSKVSKGNMPKV